MDIILEHIVLAIASCLPVAVGTLWISMTSKRPGNGPPLSARCLLVGSWIVGVAGVGWASVVAWVSVAFGCTAKGEYQCGGWWLAATCVVCAGALAWMIGRGWSLHQGSDP